MKKIFALGLCAGLFLLTAAEGGATPVPPEHTEHVLIVVCDGLRPDSVTAEDMPTLFALGHAGTVFAHHHPVYTSSTEVNGTTLATGMYPQHTGVMANVEYRPQIDAFKPISIESPPMVRKGDLITHGQYLRVPTIAAILQQAGRRTVIAGTKNIAFLWDRFDHVPNGSENSPVGLYAGVTNPPDVLGVAPPFPPPSLPALKKKNCNCAQDAWTTQMTIEKLWAGKIPTLTLVWLSEPDYSQHAAGPGSPLAKTALKSSDDCLAHLLQALDSAGARDATDVIVVSDHGFSTISRNIDLTNLLRHAGFNAFRKFEKTPATGDVMVVGSGGSVSLYVIGHDERIIARLVDYLQTTDFAGVIFTKKALPGTFSLEQAAIDTPDAPDVVVSFRWSDEKSATGMSGLVPVEGNERGPGQGIHASLSPYDMHNTLIAVGPDFKTGFVDERPSGNADIAPTVLWILGLESEAQHMDGRPLIEAMWRYKEKSIPPYTTTLEAERRQGSTTWRQHLRVTKIANILYLDEGNGGVETTP